MSNLTLSTENQPSFLEVKKSWENKPWYNTKFYFKNKGKKYVLRHPVRNNKYTVNNV